MLYGIRCFLDNSDGFQDTFLGGLVESMGKKSHVNCSDLYSHSDIHRLRLEVLQTIRQLERGKGGDEDATVGIAERRCGRARLRTRCGIFGGKNAVNNWAVENY